MAGGLGTETNQNDLEHEFKQRVIGLPIKTC